MTRIEAPTGDCPKCGEAAAFLGVEPRFYAPGYGWTGWLRWTCGRCGYEQTTPPADAPKPKLPPTYVPPLSLHVCPRPESWWDRHGEAVRTLGLAAIGIVIGFALVLK